jgi:hypothetical protein
MAIATFSMTSCTENYSNGKRVGTVTQFSKTGNFFKSYEGHLNVTQTGMNTASGFDFSLDNDNEPKGIAEILDSAQNYGWKVELTYHQVFGKNWFGNRGHTDYFITDVIVLDRNFNSIFTNVKDTTKNVNYNTVVTKDTIFTINLTLDEARKMGIIK